MKSRKIQPRLLTISKQDMELDLPYRMVKSQEGCEVFIGGIYWQEKGYPHTKGLINNNYCFDAFDLNNVCRFVYLPQTTSLTDRYGKIKIFAKNA